VAFTYPDKGKLAPKLIPKTNHKRVQTNVNDYKRLITESDKPVTSPLLLSNDKFIYQQVNQLTFKYLVS